MDQKSPPNINVTGLILSGGQGRRFGGIDKGLIELGGRPLIVWTLEALACQVCSVLISANRNLKYYRSFGHQVLSDRFSDDAGPLAGIVTGLSAARTPWVLVVPCDTPFLPKDLAHRLITALGDQGGEAAVAYDGERIQWLHALLPVALIEELTCFLDHGGRRTEEWLSRYRLALADYSDCPEAFINLNTPHDLEILSERANVLRSKS